MVHALSDVEVLRLRMHAQRLAGRRGRNVHDVLRGVTAIQAQDTGASRLSIRARAEGLDVEAVKRACNDERSVVRTWTMRGTLHVVPAEDAGWMVALLGPRHAAAYRQRRLQLGLDDATCARALTAIEGSLAPGEPLTRSDLALDPTFSRHIHAGGGWIHPAVVVDGRVVGTWRLARQGKALAVSAQPFGKFDPRLLPHLEAEAKDVGRFLGRDASLVVEDGC